MAGSVKRLLWLAWNRLARLVWSARGGRRLTVLGGELRLHPETVFPHHRRLALPAGGFDAAIVRYGDFVQMHAVAAAAAAFPERPVAIDVGAHHGAYALVLGRAARRRGGVVIAAEPNPASFAILADNVRRNDLEGTVACEPVAVGEESGAVGLRARGSESSVVAAGSGGEPLVPQVTLAEIVARHGLERVDLLLVDVEGAELRVLRGFPWGRVGLGRIFCELHPYAWREHGYGPSEFEAFLGERGLRCVDMYLREHRRFAAEGYLGPTWLLEAR